MLSDNTERILFATESQMGTPYQIMCSSPKMRVFYSVQATIKIIPGADTGFRKGGGGGG